MSRKFFVGGNWKCNGTRDSITSLTKILASADASQSEVVVAPSFVHMELVRSLIRADFAIAAQNCWLKNGAYTGEVTPDMLADLGYKWVILGHSERRSIFNESDDLIGEKVSAALAKGIKVIFCCGEKLEERKADQLAAVVTRQIKVLDKLPKDAWQNIVIAYEPVWAIGTGLTASPAQAQEAHVLIRQLLTQSAGADVANAVRIIYGGSVKADNCNELAKQADVDGFLVGGASLTQEFVPIVKAVSAKL
eukprot:TRINITY_DN4541_c0_g1_i1.p1 TRINITY_DN4541_c0_g1~~TRINITY_DN4541_c0_g1_i1.p1  ORF type:complete len:250 (+),score=62.93 TRINITY_DN4541_c0_g1_i1:206-955(+)